ncbi:MAG: SUF system NifU family Fe-S cluster assembly protein [Bacteroidia bacterium]|nr:SUF system NifU family Fe-S cluster assembly protein [Bacteroidia bacterium]
MDERLKQLYKDVILVHNKNPYHFEKKEEFPVVLKAYNPICGDKFEIYLSEEAGKIKEIYFHGFGCAISKAATSVLVETLEGKPVEEATILVESYLKSLSEDTSTHESLPQNFQAFGAAREFPGRLQCASLSWEEFRKWLDS